MRRPSLNSVILETDKLVRQAIPSILVRIENRSLRALARRALRQKREFDRALFVRIGCEACGGNWRLLKPALVAAEMIDASLIVVDDIFDDSCSRAGAPPLFQEFGPERTVAAAFALTYLAAELLAELMSKDRQLKDSRAEIGSEFFGSLRHTWEGQYQDIVFQENSHGPLSFSGYLELIKQTTGHQIGAYLRLGARLCSGSADVAAALYEFGIILGALLQIRDDYLDYFGSEEMIGKGPFSDYAAGKKRLPIILATRYSSPTELRLLNKGFGRGHRADADRALVLRAISNERAVASLRKLVGRYVQNARKIIADIPRQSHAKASLEELLFLAGGGAD